MEAPAQNYHEPEIEPGAPLPATLHSLEDSAGLLNEVTRRMNAMDRYRLGVALGRRGVIQDGLTRLGSKPHKTLGAVMSAASKFRDSLKEQYSIDLNWQEWGPGQENIRVYPKRRDTHPGMTDHIMNHQFPEAKIMLDSGGRVRSRYPQVGGTNYMGMPIQIGRVGKAGVTLERGAPGARYEYQTLFNDYERGRSKVKPTDQYNKKQNLKNRRMTPAKGPATKYS